MDINVEFRATKTHYEYYQPSKKHWWSRKPKPKRIQVIDEAELVRVDKVD